MFKMPDFLGSFYYNHVNGLFAREGVFAMYIQERKILQNNSESINGIIEDKYGHSTFEGKLTKSQIEFTKKYDLESIEKEGASHGQIYYKGNREYDGCFTGYWTNFVNIPFDKLLESDKTGFFMRQLAETQRVKILGRERILEIRKNISN